MIYKNGIKVNKVELVIDEKGLTYHFHLSNNKVWTYQPKDIDPSILHNQTKLETLSVLTMGRAMKELRRVMNDD